jgi:TPR repeat protein
MVKLAQEKIDSQMKAALARQVVLVILIITLTVSAPVFSDPTPPLSAPSSIPEATLSPEAEQYGRAQVDAVLRDRPQLQSVVLPGSEIDRWLVHAFAAPELPYKLAWKNAKSNPRLQAYSQSMAYPFGIRPSYIEVDEIYNREPGVSAKQRSADEVMAGLVFELYNARYGEERAQFDRKAIFHEITRDDYISKFAETEFNAERSAFAFYKEIWKPFSEAHSLSNDLVLWGNMSNTTFAEYLSKYPPTYWYPWAVYGSRFDAYASFNGKEVLSKAQSGDVRAEAKVGEIFYRTRDLTNAVSWLLKATLAGDVKAEGFLGFMYTEGLGLPKDQNKALDWYLKAAQQGDSYSEEAAGAIYFDKADYSKAFALYLKAAQQGDLRAEKDLAWVYRHGEGAAVDEQQAFAWSLKAAQQGDEESIRDVADRYAKGIGVPVDPAEAKRWTEKIHPVTSE